MTWYYITIFIAAVLLGIFQAPIWLIIIVLLGLSLISLSQQLYPVLLETKTDKILSYLKKSKLPYYQFIYQFFEGSTEEMEDALQKIRAKDQKKIAEVLFLLKQEQYSEAESTLLLLNDNDFKRYYSALVFLHVGNEKAYNENKSKIKDPQYRIMLQAAELEHEEKLDEAIVIIDQQIPYLKGLKRLSFIQYQKELLAKTAKNT